MSKFLKIQLQLQAVCFGLIAAFTPLIGFAESDVLSAPPITGPAETTEEFAPPTVELDRKIEFMPQFSIFNANSLRLRTDAYEVNYGAVLEGVPLFNAAIAIPYAQIGNFSFLVNTQLGLGTVRDVYPVSWNATDTTVQSRVSDRIRLVWIPMSVSQEVRYSLPGIPFFQPSLTVGAGGHLLLQRNAGVLPSEDFWIPHFFFRPALTFFDAASTAHWFGGFSFGVSWYRSLGGKNELQGTSFDLSLKFLL